MSDVPTKEKWIEEGVAAAWRDPRSAHELITFLLTEDEDDPRVSDALSHLRFRATREVFEAARALCGSECPNERAVGACILNQFGQPQRAFAEETLAVLSAMLERESETEVIWSITAALGYLQHSGAVTPLLSLQRHSSAAVRMSVAMALPQYPDDSRVIPALIELSCDADEDVRDWATFGLGTQLEADTPEVREALARRLDDPDGVTCAEALVGLAKRQDVRIVPKLREILRGGDLDFAEPRQDLVLEAVEELGDPSLLPDVLGLRDHCREKNPGLSRWLDEIIEELSAAYRQGWPVLE
jgi:HEAT repeat protein